jgi:hypothetical protein
MKSDRPICTGMAEDLAVLWSLWNGVTCSLARVPTGWRVRVEDHGVTVQFRDCRDGREAVDIGQTWQAEWRAGHRPGAPPAPLRVW